MKTPNPDHDAVLSKLLFQLAQTPDDKASWNKLYVELWPFVLAISSRLFHEMNSDAEDLAQDTFLRLLKSVKSGQLRFSEFADPRSFKSFLITICRNLHIDKWRKGRRYLQIDTFLDSEGLEMIDDLTFPLDEAVLLEETYLILLAQMSYTEQTLFDLLVNRHSPREISRKFGLTEAAARKRISRLKAKIKRIYKDLYNVPPSEY